MNFINVIARLYITLRLKIPTSRKKMAIAQPITPANVIIRGITNVKRILFIATGEKSLVYRRSLKIGGVSSRNNLVKRGERKTPVAKATL